MKRKTFLLIICILALSFSSCNITGSDYKNVKEILGCPICVSAVIEQKSPVSFKLYIYENETMFTFSEPQTLNLLTVKKNNDGYIAQYDGIETKITQNSILAADALDIALDTIRSSEKHSQQDDNGQNVLLFSIDGNNVLVYYDSKLNKIEKIISEACGQLFTYTILSVESIQT